MSSAAAQFLLGLAVIAAVPFLVGGKFAFSIGAEVAIYALALMGLNILYGWAGQISLAHAGFFGLGAYTTAFLRQWTADLPLGPGFEIVSVVVLAVAAGLIVGLPAVRVSGLQLAIVTLAFAEVFQWALNHFSNFSGGSQGILVGALEIGPFSTFDGRVRFVLALSLAGIGGLAMIALRHTPLARAMFAVRDTELAAQSVGVRPAAVKLTAFVVGSIYAAVAGWLFAYHAFAVTPGHFTLFANVFMLLAIVVGGRYSLLGAWIGAIYLVVVPELVRSIGSGNLYPILSGAILILIVLLAPRGFADLFERLAVRVRGAFFAPRREAPPARSSSTSLAKDMSLADDHVGAGPQAQSGTTPALSIEKISVRFAGLAALTDVSAAFSPGISGLVGPNGAGKTTLLNVITGLIQPSSGHVDLSGRRLTGLSTSLLAREGVVRSFQTVRLMDSETVLTNILVGRYRVSSHGSFAQMLGARSPRRRELEDEALAVDMARALGIDSADLGKRVGEIPFGGRRLVEIGRVLVSDPPIALLDEPASGLTPLEREHLRRFLEAYAARRSTIMILTEHDVDLIRVLCKHLVVLDSGSVVTSGVPAEVFADPRVRRAYFGEVK